jgi:transposase
MLNLKDASRDELIHLILAQHETIQQQARIIADQQERIAALDARVTQLTARIGTLVAALEGATGTDAGMGSGGPQGMPGLKATNVIATPKERKRRERGYGRTRMVPTQRITHAVDRCPSCGMPLVGGSVKRTREVIEVPVVPAVVRAHIYLERCCPHCRTRHTPAVELAGEVVGTQRFGVGLVSLIVTLREEARLPVRTIQWYLKTFHALAVSVGAITSATQQVARAATGAVHAIRAAIDASAVAHLDETGWRENGVNGYAWVCATPQAVHFTRGSRAAVMVEQLLGEAFAGVLVSDFYAGYAPYRGVKQKCWAHLLRDVHALREAHADNPSVRVWAAGVHDVYLRAVAWTQEHGGASDRERQEAREGFAREMTTLYAPHVKAAVPQRVLSARMAKHLHELFVFIVEPDVPPDNNQAERDLRHLVTSRKISGGTRSAAGSETKMTLASVFGTWRKQRENPYDACRALLLSPQL